MPPARLLVVKLAELGDALQISPALRELRRALPETRIDMLTTAGGAAVLRGLEQVDRLIIFDKHRFDRPAQLLQPANIWRALQLGWQLRTAGYDAVLLFHHLSTRQGALKYAAFCAATGAPRRLGLDNGRGFFLNEKVPDEGYGVIHEVDYALRVARLLAPAAERHAPRLEPGPDDLRIAAELLAPVQAGSGPLLALHPGSGAYAPVRRWPVGRFAAVADRLIAAGARIVLLGGAEEHDLRQSMLAQMQHADAVLDLGGKTTLHQLVAVLRCLYDLRRQRWWSDASCRSSRHSGAGDLRPDRSTRLGTVVTGTLAADPFLPQRGRRTTLRTTYDAQGSACL